jgi:hypothetical protein
MRLARQAAHLANRHLSAMVGRYAPNHWQVRMTSIANRSLAGAALTLLAVTAVADTCSAQSTPSEIRQREQVLKNSAEATEQRNKQSRDITEQQQQLLQYQIRKSKRTNQESQCRAAGLPNC